MCHAHRAWLLAAAACLASADPLRTGTYTKTLTFTLATTEP